MIKSNRVIKTTIFVVFLFVVLSLPIFNKPGVIFVQTAKADGYEQCTTDNFKKPELFSDENLIKMCEIFKIAGLGNFEPNINTITGIDTSIQCNASSLSKIKENLLNEIPSLGCPNAIGIGSEHLKIQNFNTAHPDIMKSVCSFCQDPKNKNNSLASTAGIAEPTGLPTSQNEVLPPGGTAAKTIPGWGPATPECAIGYSGGSFWDLITQPINLLVGALITLFTNILKFVLKAIIDAFGWALVSFPSYLGGYTSSSPVKVLWGELLKYANLGIILGMIFMAIATILRIEKYSWKKMLPKLILVALLVNFSLIICGVLVDLSNYLVFTFLSATNGNDLGNLIVDIINKVICAFRATDQEWDYVLGATVGLIITSIMIFQFAGLLFYVLIRLVTIAVCAAVSPLAFVGMAIDAEPIKKAVGMWRDRFTQALVNLVILSLTLYISLTIIAAITPNIQNLQYEDKTAFLPLIAYAGFIIALFQMVKFVANAIGVKEIQQGYDFAKKTVTGLAMAGAAVVGGAALTGIAGSQVFRTVGQRLTQTPILNKIGYKMLDQSDAARFANIRKSEEKMKTRSKDEILAIANGEAPLRANKAAYADYMGARSFALKSGWLKHDDKAIKAIKKDIENNNQDLNAKDLVHAFPQLFTYGANGKTEVLDTTAPDYTKKVADNIKKNISAEDMPKHTEQVIEAIKDAGGNVDEFLQEMVFAKTNQLRALLDNVAGDEYATGDKLTKATGIKGPWSGQNGQIATVLKNLEKKAQNNYEALAKNPQATKQDLDRATEEWMKAQQAVDELNNKLKSSFAFKETLDTEKI